MYVLKRPHVDEFLQKMGELFECVLFTASLAKVGSCETSRQVPIINVFHCHVNHFFTVLYFSVCWPCGRPAGPVGGVSRSALQRILCFPQRKLRQRPQPTGSRAPKSDHCRQLACLVHLPPWECSKCLFNLLLSIVIHIAVKHNGG